MSEEKIDALMELVRELTIEFRETRKQQDEVIKNLIQVNKDIKEENIKIKNELDELKIKMEKFEIDKRKNNIVIEGMKDNSKDLKTLKLNIKNIIETNLGVEPKMKQARPIGGNKYLVELETYENKMEIMNKKKELKKVKEQKIFINNDLTKHEREIQKEIRTFAEKMRQNGHNVKAGYRKITVDNKIWTWNDKERKLVARETTNRQKHLPKN